LKKKKNRRKSDDLLDRKIVKKQKGNCAKNRFKKMDMKDQKIDKRITQVSTEKLPGKASKKSVEKSEFFINEGKIKVPVSNPQKLYFPKEKVTKKMVVEYYQSIAKYILPFLKDRPESLKRNANGILDAGFYHKDAGENAPEFIQSFSVHSESTNKEIDYIICNDKITLAYLNNLGCIELNPWHSTIKKPDHPDYLIIDIDPSDKNNFNQVIEVARAFKKLFDKAGAECFCKTSGSTGLHIYVPMKKKYPYETIKNFAHQLCLKVNEMLPDLTTLTRNLAKRGDKKIYLDYLQNRAGQTIASVYSLRPKKGATVSMPLQWKEVKKGLTPDQFTIHNSLKRIEKFPGLFNGVFGAATNIAACIKKLGLGALGN
jgi:bifunctional non-homologous end joining protein LigD